jgi:hypothetical protein
MTDVQAERCIREFLDALLRGDAASAEEVCKSGTVAAGEIAFPGRLRGYEVTGRRKTLDGHGCIFEVSVRREDGGAERYEGVVEPRVVVTAACYVIQFRRLL